VTDATSAYFESQDVFGSWLEERCSLDGDPRYRFETVKRLYADWKEFSEAAGDAPKSSRWLGDELEKRGYLGDKATHGSRIIRGLALKAKKTASSGDEQ
jgi:putative DNA primase/helicase